MMTTKKLLLDITGKAYKSDEMCLLSGVFPWNWSPDKGCYRLPEQDLTEEQARSETDVWYQPVWSILKHVADCKAMYAVQAFGQPPTAFPEAADTLESLLAYLDATHSYLVSCLERIPDEDLGKPVPTEFHGESAANLFWVLAQHDVSHGAQIDVIRSNL
jgi:hypothetical protein